MEEEGNQEGPKRLLLIVLVYGLGALSQISSTTLLLSPSTIAPTVRSQVDSWSSLDIALPYALSVLLIISMFFLYRRRRAATTWFALYFVFDLFRVGRMALGGSWLRLNSVRVALTAAGGVLINAVVLGYLHSLRRQDTLR